MQIKILSGIYSDQASDLRTALPRNMMPVPKASGVSNGYLRPAYGIVPLGSGGPGVDRGGINWQGVCYRVMGAMLVAVDGAGAVIELGPVGNGGTVTFDYGFDRLAVWSGGRLYYWDGAALTQVTDPDLGNVIDGCWIAGYYMSTDGASLIVTELNDPLAVNPLRYGSAESDPDPILAVDKLRNEAYALGRFTIEVFQNVGGTGFPFQRIEGAQVPRGVVGTHAYCRILNTFAFLGSARNEAPAVYLMVPGDTRKLSTREVDTILAGYTEGQLAAVVMEERVEKGHALALVHLPDRTLVYDAAASEEMETPVWFELVSSVAGLGTYRARGLVLLDGKWIVGDPTGSAIGMLSDRVSTHFGQPIGWEFGTLIQYADGNDAIVHEMELVGLPGRAAFGANPVVWASHSYDGETWSEERPCRVGAFGQRTQRLQWRRGGRIRHMRMQRFRGTSDAHLSVARLEVKFEPLQTRPGNG